MKKLLIIDGSNLLFQMFFGMPARIFNKNGKGIWGSIGFIGATLKLVRKFNPTHLVVLFDGETNGIRKDLDADYKANRPDFSKIEDNENPFSQINDIYACLDFLNIKHTESEGLEVDDIIASYVNKYKNECEIIISSYDSDFFQLISSTVRVVRYKGESSVICDEKYIKEKLNIEPTVYADFKALTGDNADNIKGVKGVGPKTASNLINGFGSLENLIKNYESIEKTALKNSIKESLERLKLNYNLIKLDCHATLPFLLNELEYKIPSAKTTEVLKAVGIMD